LVFDYGLLAGDLTVRAYDIGFAGQEARLGETKSGPQGSYAISYQAPDSRAVNLQMRVADSGNKEITLSSTRFDPQPQEILNLVVPASVRPLAPEYQRLAADIDPLVGGIAKLSQAREDDERQDLRLLNQATGWDARLLALASSAAGLMQPTGMGHDVLYALLRAGLPSDSEKLCLVAPEAIQNALAKARQCGIIGLSDEQIAANVTAFRSFAGKTRLNLTATGANSTFADLFGKSGLTPEQQSAFADLYFSEAPSAHTLWQKAEGLNLPAAALDNLKLQGKLAYLTLNNARLVEKLQQDIGSLDNLSQLPGKDFHTGAAWKTYLTALAPGNDAQALDNLVPPAYRGNTPADRLEVYAAHLARKVRLSFPTEVVTRMVEDGSLAVEAGNIPKVTAVLKNASSLGYQMGRTR
jgi:hypothetical protein